MSTTPKNQEDRYSPAFIEPKWQTYWDEHHTFRSVRRPGHPKLYVLDMFPYPSGAGLHVGHPEGYTATDIVARHARMKGVDVLHPMGWDAFGLPAEQYAIQTGTHPSQKTKENIENFRRQLKMLGFSYDWEREIDTTQSDYVRWTQWIFLQIFHQGLAVQSEIPVNWCSELGTVLANEEVIDGKSERGGHPVQRIPLRQWSLKITEYADRLVHDLECVDWPDTKLKQINWIGRSEGCEIEFAVDQYPSSLRVFTTRPDTLFGATYVVIAPEHPLVETISAASCKDAVRAYVQAASARSDLDRVATSKDKTGVATGAFARHPLTGEKIPIWVADYVLGSYGTGAVMAVPGHDERDFVFAQKHDLPIIEVVSPDGSLSESLLSPFIEDGISVRSGAFDGLPTPEMKRRIIDHLERHHLGKASVSYKLRDWVFSRQRYWGEPFPIYFPVEVANDGDPRKGDPHTIRYDQPIAVDESELPVNLPDLHDFRPSNDPRGPLARALDWVFFQRDGKWFARETNTMPQWAGSCWYYLRFLDPRNDKRPFSEQSYDDWMPVDLYVGGSEHAVLHLLYARFWHKVLFDIGLVKHREPFHKLVHQGMILGENNEKMSKSRGNVINPDDVVREFGADALRAYEMFMGPLEQVKPWKTSGIQGVRRFLERVYKLCLSSEAEAKADEATLRLVHKTIKKVGDDIEAMHFNTAVSALMILSNHLSTLQPVPMDAARTLVLLLSPITPHLAEELWQRLGGTPSVSLQPWPTYDEALVREDVVEIGVQVNGKVRGRIALARDASEDEALALALEQENV
ncbi:MAG TPA: leucine--tRNA ligase, partial [Polyangiaceae bacterium]|nr:leucine--tRNA ligase [Polyangiaceae bacterium]